ALAVIARGPLLAEVSNGAVSAVLLMMAVSSLLFGAFGMLRQRSVARILGYSAIAQIGYALLALAGGESGPNAAIIHLALYAVAGCAAFVGLEAVSRIRPDWDGSLEGLSGLSRQAPLVSASLAVVMLSLTGIPLFAGFWGKLITFVAAIEGDLQWPAIVAAVAAVVSFWGYGAVIKRLYFHPEEATDTPAESARGGAPAAVLVALAAVLIAGGMVPLVMGLDVLYRLFGL
ncbi:MAG TPA: proton-conducting transporter membrane subunit, partial [Coriobacteriia bacterium]|nr:proton-conducting transporter membrane subunit [Coriobacteriia bacterium]